MAMRFDPLCPYCGARAKRGKKYCSDRHKHKMHNRRCAWNRAQIWTMLELALDPDAEIGPGSPEGSAEFARLFWDHVADVGLSVRVSRSRKAE